ncbi:MAG: response regulator transcription factor [Bryobacteraceae bacterium]|jgi:DNA-binding response OmpR family regulator
MSARAADILQLSTEQSASPCGTAFHSALAGFRGAAANPSPISVQSCWEWEAGTRHKMGNRSMRVLIVEDEEKMADALRHGLEADHYSVSVAHTGEEGFYLVSTEAYDLVILDWLLPGRDGIEVLTQLRQRGVSVPVLLLTAKDATEDRVRGLDAGADDYLVKPFAFPELLARTRALLRRGIAETTNRLTVADLEMDVAAHKVKRGGRDLALTAREFDLLEYLLRQPGRVVSREMLARDVWKESARYTPLDNVIDVHIARLRRKLDDQSDKTLLRTVRGVGFVLGEDGS